MSFREEVELHYTDPEGMITQVRDPAEKWTSGNHLLILGTYHAILAHLGLGISRDAIDFAAAVRPCEVEPGLYNRNAGRKDKQAHDDYIGVVAGSVACGAAFHKDVLSYGESHFWIFDNDGQFLIGDCFFRHPGLVPFFRASNGQKLCVFSQVTFSLSLLWNSFTNKDATSGVILRWLQIQVMGGKHWLIDRAIAFWKKRMMVKYPGGMGEVFAIYYGSGHPFAAAMLGRV